MNEQLRNFLVWLGDQTEGIDQTKLALKLQQIEDEHKARVPLSQRSHGRLAAPKTRNKRRFLFCSRALNFKKRNFEACGAVSNF
jgi:hypothetical protein